MIVFKNGKYIGGMWENIINTGDGPFMSCNWDYMLKENCWVLEIPKDSDEIKLHNPHQIDLFFIPKETDVDNDSYNIFWNSNETYVFLNIMEIFPCQKNY